MRGSVASKVGIGIFVLAILIIGITLVGCTDLEKPEGNSEQQRQQSVQERANNFSRAVAKFPQPIQENFPMREAMVKYTQRQDLLNHPWYIYLKDECFQCPKGVIYQYYVAQTYPQSTCNFLGSTEDVKVWEKGETGIAAVNTQAPSLDGIYYGSGATTGGCDYFFFDMATDAMIVISNKQNWNVSDRPLLLDAQLISAR